jgi:ABC-type glycerol-3-phosphate transport system permease component
MSVIEPEVIERATAPAPVKRQRRGSRLEWLLVHTAYVLIIAFFGAPFLWMVLAAFDGSAPAYIRFPEQPTFDNFVIIFRDLDFGRSLSNSVIVATATMLLAVLTVSLAAYSLSRLQFRGKSMLVYLVLVLQTMPISATMVPIYGLARDLNLRNSYLGLILVHAAIELPFLIWLMKGFFDSIPRYLEEAAWLDGRSKLRAWWEVVMPLAKPGIGVVAGFAFLSAWSEVLMVLILVDDTSYATVPFAFYRTARTGGSYGEVRYELVAAMGILYVLPVLILFFATRKLMVRGMMGTTRGL